MPRHAARYTVDALNGLDDEALGAVVAPGAAGVSPDRLGTALAGREHDDLAARIARLLPGSAAAVLLAARTEAGDGDSGAVRNARLHVVERLFWGLLYWHEPGLYEELVAGEPIHPGLLEGLPLEGRDVADLGAGAGRFTLYAAQRARRVVAVDLMPPLLDRLRARVREAGVGDRVDVLRGTLDHVPLPDASVDVAVACSSLTSTPPWGGPAALAEARRIVRPGGMLVVVWPDDPSFFTARGFTYLACPGDLTVHFTDRESALRLTREFYPASATAWIERTGILDVPFDVLGVRAPRDACWMLVGEDGGDELGLAEPEVERRPTD